MYKHTSWVCTLRYHVLVLQKMLCAQSFPGPYLERGTFIAPPAFCLKCSKSMGSFGRCLTVSIRHKWAVSKPQGGPWSSKLSDPQRGNAGAGQDILNRASKNTRIIRLQVHWVRMSQAWVWSCYVQCNSWDSSLLLSPEPRWSFLQIEEQNLLSDRSGMWQVDGTKTLQMFN